MQFYEFAAEAAQAFSTQFWDRLYHQLPVGGAELTHEICLPFHYLGENIGQNAEQPREEILDEYRARFWHIPDLNDLRNFAIAREVNKPRRKYQSKAVSLYSLLKAHSH